MNVDIPGVLLLDEVFLIQPGVLRSKILTCLEHKYVYLNEPYFMKSFIRFFICGRAVYSPKRKIAAIHKRTDEEIEILKDYFRIQDLPPGCGKILQGERRETDA